MALAPGGRPAPGPAPPAPPPPAARLTLISAPGSLLTQAKRSLPFPLSAVSVGKAKRIAVRAAPDLPARGDHSGRPDGPAWASRLWGCTHACILQAHTGDTSPLAPAPAPARVLVPELSPALSHLPHRPCSALGCQGARQCPPPPQQLLGPTVPPQGDTRVGHSHQAAESAHVFVECVDELMQSLPMAHGPSVTQSQTGMRRDQKTGGHVWEKVRRSQVGATGAESTGGGQGAVPGVGADSWEEPDAPACQSAVDGLGRDTPTRDQLFWPGLPLPLEKDP